MEQQAGPARWSGAAGDGHGEGVDDLRRGGGIFGIDLIEEGEHIAEQGVGVMDGQPGVEAIEGGMVGRGTEERQADEPADEQVGGELPFELGVGTGVGPGADDLGTDQVLTV